MAIKKAPAKSAPKPAATKAKPAATKATAPKPETRTTKVVSLPAKRPAVGAGTKNRQAAKSATPIKAPAPVTVTLKHLAEKFGENHAMPKKQAEAVLSDIVGLLVTHLKAGDRVRINGLGILEVKNRPARTGRNPATGATIQIAASRKIAFRPAKELKEAI